MLLWMDNYHNPPHSQTISLMGENIDKPILSWLVIFSRGNELAKLVIIALISP